MDAVSRDALTETEQTLKDLAGFLQAVKAAPGGGTDPALDETAVQIMGLATRLKTFVLGTAIQPDQSHSSRCECEAAFNVASRKIASSQHLRSVSDPSAMPDQPVFA